MSGSFAQIQFLNAADSVSPVDVSTNNPLPVTYTGGESHIGQVGGTTVRSTASFTRPGDVNAYAAKDVVSNSTGGTTLMSFTGAARVAGGSGYITGAKLFSDQESLVATFRLWLYTVNNPTVAVDNAQFTPAFADIGNIIGYIDFPAASGEAAAAGGASVAYNPSISVPYIAAGGATTIYGLLEATLGFTPESGATFTVHLLFEQN